MNKSAAEKRLAEAMEQLRLVNEAYQRALLSQSWETRDGGSVRSVTNASVTSLYNQKLSLEKKIEKLQSFIDGVSCGATRLGVRL